MPTTLIGSGRTPPGNTAWQVYAPNGIFVDINTASWQFTSTPVYITSLGGNNAHWSITGASSVYNPTPFGFRIYIRWSDGSPLTPATANASQWHINWMAMDG